MKTYLTIPRKPSVARLRVLLFLVLWLVYGSVINSSNLLEFDLQQIGVEAMVERGQFYLEGSSSAQLQPKGDVFDYRGHKYAAKQPGQFMAGSVVYFLLHKLGLSYVNHYLLTSALVTFFTTSLVLAASCVAFLRIASAMTATGRGLFWPVAATLSFGLGTSAFAYSGIAHHDALATGYLVIAFYFIFGLSRRSPTTRASYQKSASAGLFLGLTITTSILPFYMVVLCVLYFLSLRCRQLTPMFLLGLLAGMLPLFIYDAVSFGNPLRLANIAGASVFADTFWHFDPKNLGDKVVFYARALVFYAPVVAVGLFGLSYYPHQIKRNPEFLTLVGLPIVLAAFVFNISSDGDCQFGPRYLLPAMPFACLGIAGYSYLSASSERRFATVAVVLAGTVSFVVNLVGALRGAMSCPHGQNAFLTHVSSIMRGEGRSYPLAGWLLAPLLVCAALLLFDIARQRKMLAPGVA